MEGLKALGTEIGTIVLPTYKAYAPLLLRNAEAIRSTARETHSYGPHPRQFLDVYTPSSKATGDLKNSVLVFLYGGGLIRGEKINPNFAGGLVYRNLGHFFAEKLQIPVVIADYRLISHDAVFPSGGADLASAINWISAHFQKDYPEGVDLFVMGNSAGGIHTSTFLLAPDFAPKRSQIIKSSGAGTRLRGAILLSVPFHFQQADASRQEVLATYFKGYHQSLSPYGLLKSAIQNGSIEDLQDLPVLSITGSLDPEDEILVPNKDFKDEWQKSELVRDRLKVVTIDGHNHISPVLSVGTGVEAEEAWAQHVVDFVKDSVSRP